MTNLMTVAVGMMTVIAVVCQAGFGVCFSESRCARLCELWNGFPRHLKGIPGNSRQIFAVKSDFISRRCNCEAIGLSPGVFRKKRSIPTNTKPPAQENKNASEIASTTSKPSDDLDESARECRDPPDRSVNRTWRTHNISEIMSPKIQVDFVKNGSDWYANITWLPPPDRRLYGYYLVWSLEGKLKVTCTEVLNSKTYAVLSKSDGWKYPLTLQLAVFSLPGYLDLPTKARDYYLFSYSPEFLPPGFRITLEPPVDQSLKYGSLFAGVLAGIFVIAVVMGFVLYRRKTCVSHGGEGISIISTQENNNAEGFVKINNTMKPQNNDIYFASYLPENEKFSNEVATIAYKLGTMGYKVTLDKVDSVHMNEIGFNMWVDKQILEAKKYIVFCSPGYVRLWQSLTTRSNGVDNKFNSVNEQDLVRVRYEIKRISDIYSENCSTSRIVCIKMDPKMSTRQLPPWMNHNMLLWPEQKEDVIRRLNDQAAMVMDV